MKNLERIQNLPKKEKKKILWTMVIIIGIVLMFFWVRTFRENIESFNDVNLLEETNFPNINLE